MFDGHGLLRSEKAQAGTTAAIGFVMLLVGSTGLVGFRSRYYASSIGRGSRRHSPFAFEEYAWHDWLLVVVGLAVVALAIVRWRALGRQLSLLKAEQDHRFFLRAGAPRAIHGLLLQVAKRDGEVTQRERELVHRVLLNELTEKVVPQDLVNWSTKPADRNPVVSARMLARILEPSERLQVLRWCQKVAEADGELTEDESILLRDLERELRSTAARGANPIVQ